METVRGFEMGLGPIGQPFVPRLTDTVNNVLHDYANTVERNAEVFTLEVKLPSTRVVPIAVRVFEESAVVEVRAMATDSILTLQLPRVLAILHGINQRLAFGSFIWSEAIVFRDSTQIDLTGSVSKQFEALLNRIEFPMEIWSAAYRRLQLVNIPPDAVAQLAFVELGAIEPDANLGKAELKSLLRVIRVD